MRKAFRVHKDSKEQPEVRETKVIKERKEHRVACSRLANTSLSVLWHPTRQSPKALTRLFSSRLQPTHKAGGTAHQTIASSRLSPATTSLTFLLSGRRERLGKQVRTTFSCTPLVVERSLLSAQRLTATTHARSMVLRLSTSTAQPTMCMSPPTPQTRPANKLLAVLHTKTVFSPPRFSPQETAHKVFKEHKDFRAPLVAKAQPARKARQAQQEVRAIRAIRAIRVLKVLPERRETKGIKAPLVRRVRQARRVVKATKATKEPLAVPEVKVRKEIRGHRGSKGIKAFRGTATPSLRQPRSQSPPAR